MASRHASHAQDKPQDKLLTAHHFQSEERGFSLGYLAYMPKNYETNSGQEWPLLLFLHGAGERGADVWRADFHGPSKYILDHPDFPFILLSPICPSNETWSSDQLFALLAHAQKSWRVDRHRIYLTGISMGGYGTWSMALARPEKFAAVIPICGGAEMLPVILAKLNYAPAEKVQALKTLPIWAFHGAKDPAVPLEESERVVRSLKELGAAEVKLTVYPEARHDCWTQTYSNPEIYSWLLQHRR
jgi:predicted peptidase